MHISTIEAFPLARPEAARALAAFPELSALSSQLLAQWPIRAAAPQRLSFPDDRLTLDVHIGGVEAALCGMEGRFDAWFLDGFAPSRNPAMWTPAVFAEIARLSEPGARLATYTVAGDVRRGLEAAGFAVEKRPGFANKRERLEARLVQSPAPRASEPWIAFPYGPRAGKRIAILGAGIAGAACAEALNRRGLETIVLDAAPSLGAGASGNPAGLVMPRLDRAGPLSELYLSAYLAAIAHYGRLGVLDVCGVLEFPEARRAEALADLLADPPLPEDWFAAQGEGVLHKRAGLIAPQAAIAAMLRGSALMLEAEVGEIAPIGDGLVLRAPDGRAMLKADAVVLACGAALARFGAAAFLPIELSLGQIEWGASAKPPTAITRSAYCAPFGAGVLFGATFDRVTTDEACAPTKEARARNLAALGALAPDIAASIDADALNSRASLRAATPDRAPIAGLLPDAEAWRTAYADVAQGRRIDPAIVPPAHGGVYLVGGLGARGLTLAPLLAERIASEIRGEPQLLSRRALAAIHPARFLLRGLKRR